MLFGNPTDAAPSCFIEPIKTETFMIVHPVERTKCLTLIPDSSREANECKYSLSLQAIVKSEEFDDLRCGDSASSDCPQGSPR